MNLLGQTIGRYQIEAQLGEGGMATVYRALDTRLDRMVAIKFIRKDAFTTELLEQVLARFEREAKALARLTHPNIVNVHDYGEYEDVIVSHKKERGRDMRIYVYSNDKVVAKFEGKVE